MDHIGPFTFVGTRALLATLVLAPFAYLLTPALAHSGDRRLSQNGPFRRPCFRHRRGVAAGGTDYGVGDEHGVSTAIHVVATPFISFALTGKPVAPLIWFAVALSFIGTWLLGGGTLTTFGIGDLGRDLRFLLGASHGDRRHRRTDGPLGLVLRRAVFGGLCDGTGRRLPLRNDHALFCASGPEHSLCRHAPSAMSFTILTFALRATSPSEAAIIIMTETLFAAFGAWLFFNEGLKRRRLRRGRHSFGGGDRATSADTPEMRGR